MSAITGIFNRNGRSVSPEQIKKMNDSLSHRGPDGSKIWFDGPVALGHQMLHTTPESIQEELPFEDAQSGLVITSDARIDNRAELAPLLGLDDVKYVSDSFFILNAYKKWGEKCLDKLLGDFSFAIWDPTNKKLFCARDHMGVKPFYYHLNEEGFFFATEIKALFSLENINFEINEIRVADYLIPMLEDKEITFYIGIKRLIPAHLINISINTCKLERYWSLNSKNVLSLRSDKEYSSEFLKIFKDAVNCRLRSAFPVGSHLSGGLDSSSITCMACQLSTKTSDHKLETFSYTFESVPQCDETYFIQKVLDQYDLNSHFVKGDTLNPLSDYKKIFWHVDGAFYAPNLFYRWATYPQVYRKGVRILLDGIDGDITVSHGELILSDLASEMKLRKLFKEIRLNSERLEVNPLTFFFNQVIVPKIPRNLKKLIIKLFGLMNYKSGLTEFGHGLKKEFIQTNNLLKRFDIFHQKPLNKANNHRNYHHYRLNSGIIPFVLELVDSIAAASSIEVRYPFFDKRLIEFCLSLPPDQKLDDGWDRIILRRSMETILPDEIQWRKQKTNLSPNFARNFLLFEKELLDNLFGDYDDGNVDTNILDQYLDMDYLCKCYNKYKYGNNEYAIEIWRAASLALWLTYCKQT